MPSGLGFSYNLPERKTTDATQAAAHSASQRKRMEYMFYYGAQCSVFYCRRRRRHRRRPCTHKFAPGCGSARRWLARSRKRIRVHYNKYVVRCASACVCCNLRSRTAPKKYIMHIIRCARLSSVPKRTHAQSCRCWSLCPFACPYMVAAGGTEEVAVACDCAQIFYI